MKIRIIFLYVRLIERRRITISFNIHILQIISSHCIILSILHFFCSHTLRVIISLYPTSSSCKQTDRQTDRQARTHRRRQSEFVILSIQNFFCYNFVFMFDCTDTSILEIARIISLNYFYQQCSSKVMKLLCGFFHLQKSVVR